MAREVPESITAEWKVTYAELWQEISAAATTQELNKIMRGIMKRYDADLIPSKATGAIFAFKAEMKARLYVDGGTLPTRQSVQEARIERILHTGARTSNGRRIARKF